MRSPSLAIVPSRSSSDSKSSMSLSCEPVSPGDRSIINLSSSSSSRSSWNDERVNLFQFVESIGGFMRARILNIRRSYSLDQNCRRLSISVSFLVLVIVDQQELLLLFVCLVSFLQCVWYFMKCFLLFLVL